MTPPPRLHLPFLFVILHLPPLWFFSKTPGVLLEVFFSISPLSSCQWSDWFWLNGIKFNHKELKQLTNEQDNLFTESSSLDGFNVPAVASFILEDKNTSNGSTCDVAPPAASSLLVLRSLTSSFVEWNSWNFFQKLFFWLLSLWA